MAAASDVHEQARSLSATRAHLSGHTRHHSTASQPLSPGSRLSPHASSPRFVWAKFRRQVDDLLENEDFSGAAEECRSCMNSAATNEIPLSSSDLCLVLLDYGDVKRKQTRYQSDLVAEDLCFDLDSTVSEIRDLQTKPHLYVSHSSQEEAEVSSRSNGRRQQSEKPTNDDEEPASLTLHPTVTPDLIPHKEHAREAIEAYHRALQLSIECSDIALQVRCYRRFSRLILDLIYNDKAIANELLPHAARCGEEYLLKAVSLMQREEETHSLLGQLYYETHRFEESKSHLEIACKMDENETTLKLLGIIEGFHMGQLRLASKRLKKVVSMNNDTDNLFLIAHLLVCDDKLQQAHDFLRSAIAREENEAAAQSGDDDDNECIQNPDVHALFAWICTNAAFYDRNLAETHFKIALSVDKDHMFGHLYLALYYAHICDNNENAQGHFRFCHNMDKENDVTLFFYGLLQKYRLGKKQRGERYIQDASVDKLKNRLDEQQSDPDFHNSKPCFCLGRQEYNNHYHGISAWSPNQYYRQARILLSHGKMIESVEVIRRILSLEEHEGARNLLRQLYEAQQQQEHEQERKTSIEKPDGLPPVAPIDLRRRQRSDPRLMSSVQAEEYRQQRVRRSSEMRHSSPRLPGLRKRSKSEYHDRPRHPSHPSFTHESSPSVVLYGGVSPEYTASPRTPVSAGPRYNGYSSGSCPTSPTYHNMSPSLGPTARFASTYAGATGASPSGSFTMQSQTGSLPNQMYFAVEPDFVNPSGGYFGGVPGGEYPMQFDDGQR